MSCVSDFCRSAAIASSILTALAVFTPVHAGENPAHDLAQKFSEASPRETESQRAERLAAEEAEMLERARAEARGRTADTAEPAVPEWDAGIRQRDMEAQREAEAQRLADKLRAADDARRAKAADASTTTIPSDETAAAPGRSDTWKPAIGPAAPAAKPSVAESVPAPSAKPADAPPAIVAEPLPRVLPPVAPPSVHPVAPPPAAQAATEPREPRDEPPAATFEDDRVAVLLVMEPGNRGIRRFNKKADPVLCTGARCYVSTGAATDAKNVSRGRAFGPGNTFGKRAGACRQRLTCVFRGVAFEASASLIQPVDLKVLSHDRRTPRSVSADTSCRVTAGALACSRTVVAPGYRAWIVPEDIARRAGPAALEAALAKGLRAAEQHEASLRAD